MGGKREREEACNLCGHYHDYEGGEPCRECGHRLEARQDVPHSTPRLLPTAILPDWLYLGSFDVASRCHLLSSMGITHILNTVPTSANLYPTAFTYHTVSGVPPDFNNCNTFLDSAHQAGHKILVHCMTGVSRSPAVVIAYLIHHRGWNLSAASRWVGEAHSATTLSTGEQQRLRDYEATQKLIVSDHGEAKTRLVDGTISMPGSSTSFAAQQLPADLS